MFERPISNDAESNLARLFAAYRDACPGPEPCAEFMPRLWEQIESRQYFAYSLKRLSQAIITAAAAVTILMGVYLTRAPHASPFSSSSYVEALLAGQANDDLAEAEIANAGHERTR
jgi:hypothetical protein